MIALYNYEYTIMDLNIFDFNLPERQIAQNPKNKRSESKLLIINRKNGLLTDERFFNVDQYISKNDLIVVNDSRVIPARIFGKREKTNGRVEIFIERLAGPHNFFCQLKSTRKIKEGDFIIVSGEIKLKVISNSRNILYEIEVLDNTTSYLLDNFGEVPLPPYILRKATNKDKNCYQTLFAKVDGSVAAPTAALHFDDFILSKLKMKGVNIASITLHIGMGTFSTIKSKDINNHKMHSELYSVPKKTLELIENCKNRNGKIISVGTTVTRSLESFFRSNNDPDKFYETDIFIKPGYNFKIVDHLITNFHLPQSSLLVMISAFYDTKKILNAYNHAIDNDYRFFSYGDSTLIL